MPHQWRCHISGGVTSAAVSHQLSGGVTSAVVPRQRRCHVSDGATSAVAPDQRARPRRRGGTLATPRSWRVANRWVQ
eukprot:441113-Prorocentrum_minimum.AAC.3